MAKANHFCAGLNLSRTERARCRPRACIIHAVGTSPWTLCNTGRVPVVAALHGAVVGGGWNWPAHVTFVLPMTALSMPCPEGTRGIFVGGGGSVRIPKLIGVARMTDMMLTGRVYNADDGERVGFAQYHGAHRHSVWKKPWSWPSALPPTHPLTNLRVDARPATHCRATCRPWLPRPKP